MNTMEMVLATDGSGGALAAARWIATYFSPSEVRLTLLTVSPIELPAFAESVTLSEEYESYLHVKKEEARERGEKILEKTRMEVEAFHPTEVVLHGAVVPSILGYLHNHKPQMVLVGRRGHSLLVDVLIGSVSLGLVERSPVPVLVIENF